jgi:rare lipoprotein A
MKSVAKAALAAGATTIFMAAGPLSGEAQAQPVMSSWYGPGFEGSPTASGEPYRAGEYTAAHPSLPFGTELLVTYGDQQTVVRVTDRGPFVAGRGLDLSQAAAEKLGLTAAGADAVDMQVLGASSAGNEAHPSNDNPRSSNRDSDGDDNPRSSKRGSDGDDNPRSSKRGSDGEAGLLRERPYLRVVGAAFTLSSRPSKACEETSKMEPTVTEGPRLPSAEIMREQVAAVPPCSSRIRAL